MIIRKYYGVTKKGGEGGIQHQREIADLSRCESGRSLPGLPSNRNSVLGSWRDKLWGDLVSRDVRNGRVSVSVGPSLSCTDSRGIGPRRAAAR